jgi:hypothetical protein
MQHTIPPYPPPHWPKRVIITTVVQDINNYTPETNHGYGVCSVATIVVKYMYMIHVMLFTMMSVLHFYISTLRSRWAMPSMAVVYYYYYYSVSDVTVNP